MNVVGAGVTAGTPSTRSGPIATRMAVAADREALRRIASRLQALGLPRWRDPRKALAIDIEAIDRCLCEPRKDAPLIVAEEPRSGLLGLVHLLPAIDRISGRQHLQVARIVVVDGREREPVGQLLLIAAAAWARARGERRVICSACWAMQHDDDREPRQEPA